MTFTKGRATIGLFLGLCLSPVFSSNAQVLFQLRSSGSYLGVNLADIDADRAKALKLSELSGVEIVAVQDGAAAYQSGIRPGDVLLSYNGEKLLGSQQLIRLVSETPPGRRVRVAYWRAGEQKQLWLTTGSARPVSSDDVYSVSTVQVTDVPSPMLLWRNLLLGMESESLNEQLAQAFGVKQGILIWSVEAGSAAQHAGLRAGDVLTDFCGHAVRSPREVGMVLQQLQNGSKPLSVNLMRDHKAISITIPVDGGDR